jgi:excisionase family DNA binding protein
MQSRSAEPKSAIVRGRQGKQQRDGDLPGALLTAGEVAQLLGVPRTWVYEQSRCGRIPTVTLGRYRRYRREAIEAWVEQLEAPARGARAYAGASR